MVHKNILCLPEGVESRHNRNLVATCRAGRAARRAIRPTVHASSRSGSSLIAFIRLHILLRPISGLFRAILGPFLGQVISPARQIEKSSPPFRLRGCNTSTIFQTVVLPIRQTILNQVLGHTPSKSSERRKWPPSNLPAARILLARVPDTSTLVR